MARLGRLCSLVFAVVLGLAASLAPAAAHAPTTASVGTARARLAPVTAPALPAQRATTAIAGPSGATRDQTTTQAAAQERGLEATIDLVRPATLREGRPLEVVGLVTNTRSLGWRDAQVYLDIGFYPATTAEDLATVAATEQVFGTRIATFGLFDQIGDLPGGTSRPYSLSIPYDELPISGTPGVYHVGVAVIAGAGENRDLDADASADTLVPLLPPKAEVTAAPMLTLLPITAPVTVDSRGDFLDDRLAQEIGVGGRLRNLLDFALQAPSDTLQIVLDPALHQAVSAMSEGYDVRRSLDSEPVPGEGSETAVEWLVDLNRLVVEQSVLLLPWGTPLAHDLVANDVPAAVQAAVAAGAAYQGAGLPIATVGWEPDGYATGPALARFHDSGTTAELVSEASLPALDEVRTLAYPPATVSLTTRSGQLTAIVVSEDIAGERVRPTTSALEVRQYLMAESVVSSLSGRLTPTVVALPFSWDPGGAAAAAELADGLEISTFRPSTVSAVLQQPTVEYKGRVTPGADAPELSTEQIDLIRSLRYQSRVLTDIVNDQEGADEGLEQQLALSGSASWVVRAGIGRVLTGRDIRLMKQELARVTVVAPTFVTLSSGSGPFPVTVTNGLDVPITVGLSVVPRNPALVIDPVGELALEPGQSRDISVQAHSEGSGLTVVRIRLSTNDGRRFGEPWDLDVRATQIGLAIWIIMGVGLTILVGTAVFRIIRRIRSPGAFSPREEPMHR